MNLHYKLKTHQPRSGVQRSVSSFVVAVGLLFIGLLSGGCYSLKNHFLDPSQVGDFDHEATFDIRSTLSLQDTPDGIPGSIDPRPGDLKPTEDIYRFAAGDTIQVRVLELLGSGSETPTQAVIDELGEISMPVLGRIKVAGATPAELEQQIKQTLAEKEILKDAQVIVEPVVRRRWVYGIFGVVAAPNVYPLSHPDLKVVDAFNFAGGIADTVEEVYVFRNESGADAKGTAAPGAPATFGNAGDDDAAVATSLHLTEGMESGGRGLLLHAMANRNSKSISKELSKARQTAQPNGEQPASNPPEGEPGDEPADSASQELAPDAPPSGYIFSEHEWIPTEATAQPGQVEPQAPVTDQPAVPTDSLDWDSLAADEPQQTIIRLDAERLRNGDPRENIVIRPGDVIRSFAGAPGEYFMMGQIQRPGAYSLTGRKVTLMQAVAAAGGLGPLAWPTRCTIYRRYGDRREMQQLNLDRMFAGRDPDLELKKDDIVLVGTHPAAPFLLVLRNSFRMTYGFGFVYDRNFADIDAFAAQQNPETVRQFQPRFDGIFN